MPRMLRMPKSRYLTSIPCWLYEWAQNEKLLPENERDDAVSFYFFHQPQFPRSDAVRAAVLEAVRQGELTVAPPDGAVLTHPELLALEEMLTRMVPRT